MSAAVTPDTLAVEFRKPPIALARPLVPEVPGIMLLPIIPPIAMEIWVPAFMPSITPSDASLMKAVTIGEDADMPSVLAYCDIAASVMP